jgi:hypothetical protein
VLFGYTKQAQRRRNFFFKIKLITMSVKKKTQTPPSEAVMRPIGTQLQKVMPELEEVIGVHPVTRSFLSQYDNAIAQNKQLIKDAEEKIKQIEFAKNQLLRLEIAKEGMSVAATKPQIAHSEDYSTVTFYSPARRVEPTA